MLEYENRKKRSKESMQVKIKNGGEMGTVLSVIYRDKEKYYLRRQVHSHTLPCVIGCVRVAISLHNSSFGNHESNYTCHEVHAISILNRPLSPPPPTDTWVK